MLNDIKGFSKTVGGSGVGLSSVRVGVRVRENQTMHQAFSFSLVHN